MSNPVSGAAEGIKETFTAPREAAREHFWVFLILAVFLSWVAFMAIERRRPGSITGLVQNTVGRVPVVNRVLSLTVVFFAASLVIAGQVLS